MLTSVHTQAETRASVVSFHLHLCLASMVRHRKMCRPANTSYSQVTWVTTKT